MSTACVQCNSGHTPSFQSPLDVLPIEDVLRNALLGASNSQQKLPVQEYAQVLDTLTSIHFLESHPDYQVFVPVIQAKELELKALPNDEDNAEARRQVLNEIHELETLEQQMFTLTQKANSLKQFLSRRNGNAPPAAAEKGCVPVELDFPGPEEAQLKVLYASFLPTGDVMIHGQLNHVANVQLFDLSTVSPDFQGDIEVLKKPELHSILNEVGGFVLRLPAGSWRFTEQYKQRLHEYLSQPLESDAEFKTVAVSLLPCQGCFKTQSERIPDTASPNPVPVETLDNDQSGKSELDWLKSYIFWEYHSAVHHGYRATATSLYEVYRKALTLPDATLETAETAKSWTVELAREVAAAMGTTAENIMQRVNVLKSYTLYVTVGSSNSAYQNMSYFLSDHCSLNFQGHGRCAYPQGYKEYAITAEAVTEPLKPWELKLVLITIIHKKEPGKIYTFVEGPVAWRGYETIWDLHGLSFLKLDPRLTPKVALTDDQAETLAYMFDNGGHYLARNLKDPHRTHAIDSIFKVMNLQTKLSPDPANALIYSEYYSVCQDVRQRLEDKLSAEPANRKGKSFGEADLRATLLESLFRYHLLEVFNKPAKSNIWVADASAVNKLLTAKTNPTDVDPMQIDHLLFKVRNDGSDSVASIYGISETKYDPRHFVNGIPDQIEKQIKLLKQLVLETNPLTRVPLPAPGLKPQGLHLSGVSQFKHNQYIKDQNFRPELIEQRLHTMKLGSVGFQTDDENNGKGVNREKIHKVISEKGVIPIRIPESLAQFKALQNDLKKYQIQCIPNTK